MNNGSPTADAPVPQAGTEQTADQAVKQQQAAPPAESSTPDTVSSVLDGVSNVAEMVDAVCSIFG